MRDTPCDTHFSLILNHVAAVLAVDAICVHVAQSRFLQDAEFSWNPLSMDLERECLQQARNCFEARNMTHVGGEMLMNVFSSLDRYVRS